MFLYENGTGGEGVGMVRREIRHYSFLLSGIRMYNDCLLEFTQNNKENTI